MVPVLALLAGTTWLGTGCSSTPTSTHRTVPICASNTAPLTVESTTGQTVPAPVCTPTTTTLTQPLALGTAASLSYPIGPGSHVSGDFNIRRIWMNASPELVKVGPGLPPTLPEAVALLLRASHLPPTQKLKWVGVDLSAANTGTESIELDKNSVEYRVCV